MKAQAYNANSTCDGVAQDTVVHRGFWFRVTRRPSVPGTMIAVIVLSGILCYASNPEQAFDAWIPALLFAGPLCLLWFLRLIVLGVYSSSGGSSPSMLQWTVWAVLPAMVILTTVLIKKNVPVRVRLTLSESELISFVQDSQSQKISAGRLDSRQVGLFKVKHVKVQGDCVRLTTSSNTLVLERYGLAYCPDGTLPAVKFGSGHYEHLHGPWWIWRDNIPLLGPRSFPTFHLKLDRLF